MIESQGTAFKIRQQKVNGQNICVQWLKEKSNQRQTYQPEAQ